MDASQMMENFQALLLQTEERRRQDSEKAEERQKTLLLEAEERRRQEAEETERRQDEKRKQEAEERKQEADDIKELIQQQKPVSYTHLFYCMSNNELYKNKSM